MKKLIKLSAILLLIIACDFTLLFSYVSEYEYINYLGSNHLRIKDFKRTDGELDVVFDIHVPLEYFPMSIPEEGRGTTEFVWFDFDKLRSQGVSIFEFDPNMHEPAEVISISMVEGANDLKRFIREEIESSSRLNSSEFLKGFKAQNGLYRIITGSKAMPDMPLEAHIFAYSNINTEEDCDSNSKTVKILRLFQGDDGLCKVEYKLKLDKGLSPDETNTLVKEKVEFLDRVIDFTNGRIYWDEGEEF